MSKKVRIKRRARFTSGTQALFLMSVGDIKNKKTGRPVRSGKVTSCFDGAGDLNPTKTKVGQPKKR